MKNFFMFLFWCCYICLFDTWWGVAILAVAAVAITAAVILAKRK